MNIEPATWSFVKPWTLSLWQALILIIGFTQIRGLIVRPCLLLDRTPSVGTPCWTMGPILQVLPWAMCFRTYFAYIISFVGALCFTMGPMFRVSDWLSDSGHPLRCLACYLIVKSGCLSQNLHGRLGQWDKQESWTLRLDNHGHYITVSGPFLDHIWFCKNLQEQTKENSVLFVAKQRQSRSGHCDAVSLCPPMVLAGLGGKPSPGNSVGLFAALGSCQLEWGGGEDRALGHPHQRSKIK